MKPHREVEAAFILGKAIALIEDIYIAMRDPLIKNDYGHKYLLLKQEVERFLNDAFSKDEQRQ